MHRAPTCDVPRLATDEGDVSGVQHHVCSICDATSDSQRTTYSVQHATCRTQLAMHSLRLEAGLVHRARAANMLQLGAICCSTARTSSGSSTHAGPGRPSRSAASHTALQHAVLFCSMVHWVGRHLNVQRQLYPRRPRPTLTHSVHRRIQDMRHTMRVSAAPQRVRRYHNLRRTLSPTQSFAHETAHVAGSGAARCHT